MEYSNQRLILLDSIKRGAYDYVTLLFKENETKMSKYEIIRHLISLYIRDIIDRELFKNFAYSLAQEMKKLSPTYILTIVKNFSRTKYGTKQYKGNDAMTYIMFETLNSDIILGPDGAEIYLELSLFCTEQFILDYYARILGGDASLISNISRPEGYENLISEEV